MFTAPTTQQFENQFYRDFPFGTDPQVSVTTLDITNAFNLVDNQINQSFFPNQTAYIQGYNLLAAHYLVTNLRNSSQGINGQYNFLQQSKSVGSIAESFGIPQRVLDNPEMSMLCKTNYGALYLQIILPQLAGQMFSVWGPTNY